MVGKKKSSGLTNTSNENFLIEIRSIFKARKLRESLLSIYIRKLPQVKV